MSTLVAQTISNGTVSTSSTNVIQGSAKAWVNFNGSGGSSIRASYNVSSVTRNNTGIYTVNFTNALADANYAAVVTAGGLTGGGSDAFPLIDIFTTSSFRISIVRAAFSDASIVCSSVFD
jgi:hypothetical protein